MSGKAYGLIAVVVAIVLAGVAVWQFQTVLRLNDEIKRLTAEVARLNEDVARLHEAEKAAKEAKKKAELLPGLGFPPISLRLPLNCTLGKDCWVANYVDDDPSSGAADFNCGPRTYNGHKGTDFMIRDLALMKAGVPVLAAADGVVVGYRDGMEDINFRRADPESIKGRECGNRIGIQHGNSWLTQYCHMRKGSVTVRNGDFVHAGQVIGMVGLSGKTEFPHVHLMVVHGRTVVDPFVGVGKHPKCGMGVEPLWSASVLKKIAYEPVELYAAGFANEPAEAESVRAGRYRQTQMSRDIPLLSLWVDMLGVRAGDHLTFLLRGPNGSEIVDRTVTLERTQARAFHRIDVKTNRPPWPVGDYVGDIELLRNGPAGPTKVKVERKVTLH